MSAQPTGVAIIDRTLGGLAPGLPCVLAGPSGAGRTVLSLQLAAAALEQGRVVAFLCSEPPPLLVQQARTLGLELDPALSSGQLLLLELDSNIASTVRSNGLGSLVEAVKREEPLVGTLVVDPFTVLTCEILDEPQLRELARSFVQAASPMSIVLTLESERLALQQGLERVLSEVCGAYATLHRDGRGRRHFVVEKSRSGLTASERIDFEIGDRGAIPVETESATVELPPDSLLPATEAAEESPVAGRRRILLVDPDPESRSEVSKWLESHYELSIAGDGFEAMTTLLTHRPNLVILDLVMPRVTGYELLAAFRRGANMIPLLVLSSRVARPSDRLGPLVLGATDLLAKPVERFELMHKIEMLLSLSGSAPQLVDPAEAEALFGSVSTTRVLEEPAFRSRLARACDFGDRFGQISSLVAYEAPSGAYLDRLLEVADENLRFEDALLRVSGRRMLVLLIATPPQHAEEVLERLQACFRDSCERAGQPRWRVLPAEPIESDTPWRDLFRELTSSADEGS